MTKEVSVAQDTTTVEDDGGEVGNPVISFTKALPLLGAQWNVHRCAIPCSSLHRLSVMPHSPISIVLEENTRPFTSADSRPVVWQLLL